MRRSILALLKAYKRWLSPLCLSSCRYVPTCSEYAMEAVERHGAIAGPALAAARILRCHPLARGGFDPVPDCFHERPAQFQDASLHSATFCTHSPASQSQPRLAPFSHGRE